MMGEGQHLTLFAALMIALVLAAAGLSLPHVPSVAAGTLFSGTRGGSVLFVGDIMLAREVERITDRFGRTYPFEGTVNLIERADAAVGNFEGTIPPLHVSTPDFGFRFSIPADFMRILQKTGFDVLSLGNNHAYDFGPSGISNTRRLCNRASIRCVGDPQNNEAFSSTVFTVGTTKVGILALQATEVNPPSEAIEAVLQKLSETSDLQVVYVHWGIEYEPTHSSVQQQLARAAIDAGADAVIGHHPHVVQDIEVYEGKPIFYSLGNFVFDQYINRGTEEGLVIEMQIRAGSVRYVLIPVSSMQSPSQPRLMSIDEKDQFISDLKERSVGIQRFMQGGAIVVPR